MPKKRVELLDPAALAERNAAEYKAQCLEMFYLYDKVIEAILNEETYIRTNEIGDEAFRVYKLRKKLGLVERLDDEWSALDRWKGRNDE